MAEERAFVQDWLQEDFHTKHIYQALKTIQAKLWLKDWLKRYQYHPCGAGAKIAKIVVLREKEMIETILSLFSNGIMEGTNNKIKLIKRRGLGLKKFQPPVGEEQKN